MCAVYLTVNLVIDTGHSKAPRMEVRNMYRNWWENLVISCDMKYWINIMMDLREREDVG
jgi:hypothetical protein